MKSQIVVQLKGSAVFLAALCSLAAQAQYSPPTIGLVSWWRAEGNANDSADGNNGTALNGAGYAVGISGSSFSFDGNNDHIRVPNSANLNLTSALTVGAWVSPSSYGNYHEILSKWDIVGINQTSYTFSIHPNGEAYLTLSATGSGPVYGIAFTTNAVVPLNTWTHLAASYDGSFVRIYMNGVLKGQTAYTSGIFSGTDALGIGGSVGGGSVGQALSLFAGKIDEVTLYNRALSSGEIVTLATVPEPSSLAIIVTGFAGILVRQRRQTTLGNHEGTVCQFPKLAN